MSNSSQLPNGAGRSPRKGDKTLAFIVLVILLFAEAALLLGLLLWLVLELVTVVPVSYPSAVALIVLVALSTVWMSVVAFNTLKGRSWVRAAVLTWQVLQIAIAVGCFQGFYARPDIGWALLVPSLVVIALLFAPSVATQRMPRA